MNIDVKFKKAYPEKVKWMEHAQSLGIELDINKRWEKGIDHHPKSLELMEAVSDIDFILCEDYFCWKTGGDGDNGESLMYEMDIYFEYQDILNLKKL